MQVKLTYRFTSRLSMRIAKNGDVHVSAPIGLPKKTVEKFIAEHLDWIEQARKRTLQRQQQRAAFYGQLPLKTRKERTEAIARLDAIVKPMVERYSQQNIKTHAICFSIYTLLLPEWCIEHVVAHELCHLLEPTHNARFHALMDQYFPRWRAARKQTRLIQS